MVILDHLQVIIADAVVVVTLAFIAVVRGAPDGRREGTIIFFVLVQFFDAFVREASNIRIGGAGETASCTGEGRSIVGCALAPTSGIMGREIYMLLCDSWETRVVREGTVLAVRGGVE